MISSSKLLQSQRFLIAPACLIVVVAIFGIAMPRFATASNAASIAAQVSVLGLLAVGQMFALTVRGFDISVGAVAAAASTACALMINAAGPIGFLAGPLVGFLVGSLNGMLIGMCGLQPIVVTLGTLIGVRGLALLISNNGQVVPVTAAFDLTSLAYGSVMGIAPVTWLALVLAVAAAWVIRRTTIGRRILMVGSNPDAAALVGISVKRVQVTAYQVCGLFAGCAGAVMMMRAGSGLPTDGSGMELQSIAAAVIGGTALSGGVAAVGPVVMGAAFIQALVTGLNQSGVSPFIVEIAIGVVLIGSGLLAFLTRSLARPGQRSRPSTPRRRET